jgi:hypothetical protein
MAFILTRTVRVRAIYVSMNKTFSPMRWVVPSPTLGSHYVIDPFRLLALPAPLQSPS